MNDTRYFSLTRRRSIPGAVVLALAACATLTACTTQTQSRSPGTELMRQGLRLERSLPAELPQGITRFPHSQFVLVSPDNMAGILVPVPFVAEAVVGQVRKHEAQDIEQRLARLAPYAMLASAMASSTLLRANANSVPVQPFARLLRCSDDQVRIAMVARMRLGEWTGRYMAHLGHAYNASVLTNDHPDLARMEQDMGGAARILARLIEQDARGELDQPLYRADIGSLQLTCSTVSGVLPATLVLARNAAVVQEGADHIVIRVTGDPGRPANADGLMCGLHYLRKDQLHTFRKL